MKTEIITDKIKTEIDWDKPNQLFKTDDGLIVINDGNHKNDKFSARVLGETDSNDWDFMEYANNFYKPLFTPITEPITIKFIPE